MKMKTKYLLILDCRSTIGSIYLNGNNDGTVTDGKLNHPLLDCTEIKMNNPYYIFAIRSLKKEGASHQSVYLPHGSVVAIYQYAEEQGYPPGFSCT